MPSKSETETAKLKRLLAAEKRKKAVETAKLKKLMAMEKAKKQGSSPEGRKGGPGTGRPRRGGRKTPPIEKAPRAPRGRKVPPIERAPRERVEPPIARAPRRPRIVPPIARAPRRPGPGRRVPLRRG